MPNSDDREPDGEIHYDEASERSWINYLASFKSEVYPTFEKYGFTYAEAFMMWQSNIQVYAIDRLIEKLDDKF